MVDNDKNSKVFIERELNDEVEGEYDEEGFFNTPNGSFWDPDGVYFNKEGYDKHGGYYDEQTQEYVPGKGWDEANNCYKDEINDDYYDEYGSDHDDLEDDGYGDIDLDQIQDEEKLLFQNMNDIEKITEDPTKYVHNLEEVDDIKNKDENKKEEPKKEESKKEESKTEEPKKEETKKKSRLAMLLDKVEEDNKKKEEDKKKDEEKKKEKDKKKQEKTETKEKKLINDLDKYKLNVNYNKNCEKEKSKSLRNFQQNKDYLLSLFKYPKILKEDIKSVLDKYLFKIKDKDSQRVKFRKTISNFSKDQDSSQGNLILNNDNKNAQSNLFVTNSLKLMKNYSANNILESNKF